MLKQELAFLKKELNTLKSKSKLQKILIVCILITYSFLFFSIPSLSFRASLNKITWIFTILFLIFLSAYVITCKQIVIDFLFVSLFIFCFSALISSAINGFLAFVFTPILLALFSSFFYAFLRTSSLPKQWFLVSLYFGVIFFSIYYFINYRIDLLSLNFTRLGALFGDENDIALFFALESVIAFYFIFFNKGIIFRIINFVIFSFSSFCGLSTGSKSFLLAILVCSIFIVVSFFGKKRWYVSAIIFGSLLSSMILLLSLPPFATIKFRVLQMLSTLIGLNVDGVYGVDFSSLDRFRMFLDGFELFLRKPIFGFGIQGFFVYSSFGGGWSHNNFSETLCDFGIVGTFFFHLPLFYSLFKGCNYSKRENRYQYVLTCFYIVMMFVVALNSQKLYAFSLPLVLSTRENNKNYVIIKIGSIK